MSSARRFWIADGLSVRRRYIVGAAAAIVSTGLAHAAHHYRLCAVQHGEVALFWTLVRSPRIDLE